MARYYGSAKRTSSSRGGKKSTSRKSTSTISVKKLAYMMGQIDAGKKHSNSQVSASYKAGQNSVQFKNKKPLF